MLVTLTVEEGGVIDVAEAEGDYLAPDRLRLETTQEEEQQETVVIGRIATSEA